MQHLNESSEYGEESVFHPQPSALSKLTTHKRSQLDQGNNLGIYSNIRIDNYQGGSSEGRLIKLIYYDHIKKKFEIDNTGLSLLQRYSSYELGFVSILGEKQNGKSFIFDKILNLSGVKGNHFSVNQQEGIWIWSQPFKKRNMKIFLLDCQGFNTQQVKNHETKFTEILLLLSSVTLFNHRSRTHCDDLSCFEWMLKDITKNIKLHGSQYDSKNLTICRNLQHIYRSQQLSRPSQQLAKYFQEYSFTYLQDAMTPGYQYKDSDLIQCSFLTTQCVNERFIRHIALIYKSIMGNILERSFNDINFEGSIVIKFINHILNRINNNQIIDIGVIFEQITKQLYKSAYNFCILNYTEMLQKQFRNQQPKSVQTLLSIFSNLRDNILQTYNNFNLNQSQHQLYLQKLQQHISAKQAMIITINKRKTQNILSDKFKNVSVTTSAQAVDELNKFHDFRKDLDHGRDEVMIEFCRKLLESVVKSSDNLELQEQVENMKKMIADKENNLMQLKKRADELEEKYYSQKQSSMNNKSKEEELDKKIEMEHQKQNALYKDNSNAMEELERITQQYQDKIRSNQSEIDQLNQQIKLKTSAVPDKLDESKRKFEEQQLRKKDNLLKDQIDEADKEIERLRSQIEKKHSKNKK